MTHRTKLEQLSAQLEQHDPSLWLRNHASPPTLRLLVDLISASYHAGIEVETVITPLIEQIRGKSTPLDTRLDIGVAERKTLTAVAYWTYARDDPTYDEISRSHNVGIANTRKSFDQLYAEYKEVEK